MRLAFNTFVLFFISLLSSAQSLDVTLLELNFSSDSDPQDFFKSESGFYFTADDGVNGRALWFSDGTIGGTYLVKDIREDAQSPDIYPLNEINGIYYFTADDDIVGREIWRSDGTESGTYLLKDIRPVDMNPNAPTVELFEFNDELYFGATENVNGYELWKSDGTEEGTMLFKDINPNGSGFRGGFFLFNSELYFFANDGTHGVELWKSDGTENGTQMVVDINTYEDDSSIFNTDIFILGNHFYFSASDGPSGFELWKSDGTASGTQIVQNLNTANYGNGFIGKGIVLNDEILFVGSDGSNGLELYKSDGTEEGTVLVKDINPGIGNSINNFEIEDFEYFATVFIEIDNTIFFIADNGINGREIWKSDGTTSGTQMVVDLIPDGDSYHLTHLTVHNDHLLFAKNLVTGNFNERGIWKTDGTESGTVEIYSGEIRPDQGIEYMNINGQTILSSQSRFSGNELYVLNETLTNVNLFKDLNILSGSGPSTFHNYDGVMLFEARVFESGNQLCRSDGTLEGTYLIKEINQETGFTSIVTETTMVDVGGEVFFAAFDGVNGYELWKTDGTEEGTVLVKDINPGPQSGLDSDLVEYEYFFRSINGLLYFAANNGVNGREIWASDGTENGTFMIKDIRQGPESGSGAGFVELNGEIYFGANDGVHNGIWKTDGTENGTIPVLELSEFGLPTTQFVVNDKLILVKENAPYTEFWASDGTLSGTTFLISTGGFSTQDRGYYYLNNEIYFSAESPNNFRDALFKTDGTPEGTIMLYEGQSSVNIEISLITPSVDKVYFGLSTSDYFAEEIWTTDGTEDGTYNVVGSIENPFENERFTQFSCIDNVLFYKRDSTGGNNQLWATNGLVGSETHFELNIINGGDLITLSEITNNGEQLFFHARSEYSGTELYTTIPNLDVLSVKDFEPFSEVTNIKIFPNPSSSIVNVVSPESKITNIEIYDISGKRLSEINDVQMNAENLSFDVRKLESGIYIVRVFTEFPNSYNVKLVVE